MSDGRVLALLTERNGVTSAVPHPSPPNRVCLADDVQHRGGSLKPLAVEKSSGGKKNGTRLFPRGHRQPFSSIPLLLSDLQITF